MSCEITGVCPYAPRPRLRPRLAHSVTILCSALVMDVLVADLAADAAGFDQTRLQVGFGLAPDDNRRSPARSILAQPNIGSAAR
jgi:hypothetical protein